MADSKAEAFPIGELSKRTGCPKETIRYYERIGLLGRAQRTDGGRRYYSPEDVARLSMIRRAREFGFPLTQIERLIALAAEHPVDHQQAYGIASAHLEQITRRVAELERIAGQLKALVEIEDGERILPWLSGASGNS